MMTPIVFTGVLAQNMIEYGGVAGTLAGLISSVFDTVTNIVHQTSPMTWAGIGIAVVLLWLFLRR